MLECTSTNTLGMLGWSVFLGFTISGVLLQLLGQFDRWKIIVIFLFIEIAVKYGILFTNHFWVRCVLLFVHGLCTISALESYILLTDIIPKNRIYMATSLFLSIDFIFNMLAPTLYFLLGGKDWFKIYTVIFLITSTPLFVLIFWLPKSPRISYEK